MFTNLMVGLAAALAVALATSFYAMDRIRRREALFRWASTNGFRVLKFSQPIVEATPFRFTPSKAQPVFKITVADSAGLEQTGFVRLGDMLRGLSSTKAEVCWR